MPRLEYDFSHSVSSSALRGDGMDNIEKIPEVLKRLVRVVTRMFYPVEQQVVMDLLVKDTIMTEAALSDRLQFEPKQLRSILALLRNDKFLSSRIRLEGNNCAKEDKPIKVTYHYIDYKLFINVLKYRLDMMRRRIEMDLSKNCSRASFYCPECSSKYTDLDVIYLFDKNSGLLICTYCRHEVKEEDEHAKLPGCREILEKFQTVIRENIDQLLMKCEGIHLDTEAVEPEVRNSELNNDVNMRDSPSRYDSHLWSGDRTKHINPADDVTKQVLVTIEDGESRDRVIVPKEKPSWLTESTVHIQPSESKRIRMADPDTFTQTMAPGRVPHIQTHYITTVNKDGHEKSSNDSSHMEILSSSTSLINKARSETEIMNTLLQHEKKSRSNNFYSSFQEGSTAFSEFPLDPVTMKTDVFTVLFKDEQVPYNSITKEMLTAMTADEKKGYIEVGRRIHEFME